MSGCVKFRHKGLQAFFERDEVRRLPGYRIHALKGDRRVQWSIRVSGNWRVTCRFVEGGAVDIDLVDYH